MQATETPREELAKRAEAVYHELRTKVETPENIGKMIVIDVDSGDYEIDTLNGRASRRLRVRHPGGELFGIRIGYKVAESFSGVRVRREL